MFGDIQICFKDGTINYNKVLLGVLEPVVINAMKGMHDLNDVTIIYPDKSLQSLKELHKPQDIPLDDVIEFEVQIGSTVPVSENNNCSVCNRIFSSKKQERRHYYYKHYNNTSFNKMSEGKVRKKTHKKEATGAEVRGNVACSSCGKTFKRKQGLDRHMETVHSSEVLTRFHCNFCNSTFNRKDNLFRHVSQAHPTI